MWERLLGSRNALVLRNAPATEREFNVLRTALDLTFALRVAFPAVRVAFPAVRVAFPALRVAFPVVWSGVLWPTELFEGCTVEARLARELGRAAARDTDGLALM
jgi:hypothetical protein